MVFTAIMTTVSIAVLLAIGFVGWIIWEVYTAPQLSEVDENRLAERIRRACMGEISDFD